MNFGSLIFVEKKYQKRIKYFFLSVYISLFSVQLNVQHSSKYIILRLFWFETICGWENIIIFIFKWTYSLKQWFSNLSFCFLCAQNLNLCSEDEKKVLWVCKDTRVSNS